MSCSRIGIGVASSSVSCFFSPQHAVNCPPQRVPSHLGWRGSPTVGGFFLLGLVFSIITVQPLMCLHASCLHSHAPIGPPVLFFLINHTGYSCIIYLYSVHVHLHGPWWLLPFRPRIMAHSGSRHYTSHRHFRQQALNVHESQALHTSCN